MNADELIRYWAAKKLGVPVERVSSAYFEHEEGWTSDSGTGWPEETYAVITLNNPTAVDYIPVDGPTAIPELLQEILDSDPNNL